MSLPEPEEVERLAIGELRSLVESLLAEMAQLRAENAALREEVVRLKGLPPRPKLKPSGMEKAGLLGPVTAKVCELAIGEEPSWINGLALWTPRSPGSRSRFSDRAWRAGG